MSKWDISIEVDPAGDLCAYWRNVGSNEVLSATVLTDKVCVYASGSGVPAKYIRPEELPKWLDEQMGGKGE